MILDYKYTKDGRQLFNRKLIVDCRRQCPDTDHRQCPLQWLINYKLFVTKLEALMTLCR